jgi:hypothetical protein
MTAPPIARIVVYVKDLWVPANRRNGRLRNFCTGMQFI